MKISISIFGLGRIGERASEIVEHISDGIGHRPTSMWLRDYDRNQIAASDLFHVAGKDPIGGLEVAFELGHASLSWRYTPNAWFQLVLVEVDVDGEALPRIAGMTRHLSGVCNSAYSRADLMKTVESHVKEFSGEGVDDPWDRLDDLYWYNYFGPELTHALLVDHGLQFDCPGLTVRRLGNGCEVQRSGHPGSQTNARAIDAYLLRAGVFRKYAEEAKFRLGRVAFDYSAVRGMVRNDAGR